MIDKEKLYKTLLKLLPHTATSARNNQRYRIPFVIRNEPQTNLSTHSEEDQTYFTKDAAIYVTDRYRYDGRWYSYKYSVNNLSETCSIIKVNVSLIGLEHEKKSSIVRLDIAAHLGYITPFLLFIDGKFVNWDNIDIVYDCDDIWLLLRGEKYNYYAIQNKEICLIAFPFQCEYSGVEPDWLFNLNYNALKGYLQDTSVVENGRLVITPPTIDTSYKYNDNWFNVGGWLYSQIRRYYRGQLSSTRVSKLSSITVNNYTRDTYGSIIDTQVTQYNTMGSSEPMVKELYTERINTSYYNSCLNIAFDSNGILSSSGAYKIYITTDKINIYSTTSNSDRVSFDLSSIDNVLFRENYLIFVNGSFDPTHKLMTSLNNIVFTDNPDKDTITILAFYHKDTDHVTRNTDNFKKSYVNDQANMYLEELYYSKHIRAIDYFILDTEVTYVPALTDYIAYINGVENDAIQFVTNAIPPLDFEFINDKLKDENVSDIVDQVVAFNPSLLNSAYRVYIESRTFTGREANASLIYTFAYEDRRGIKIPRKSYNNHEAYFMLFRNGELFSEYYRTIVYSNFFFIPVDNNFSFNNNDLIEVVYFKNVNNNEISFDITSRLLSKFTTSPENAEYVNTSVFEPYIKSDELQIFASYPRNMLAYPTLITKPSESIAFNISYRDSSNNLCVKRAGLSTTDGNKLTATSKRKFIYQRLYVPQKSYRIKLDKKFRYCDNQRHYLLFINGRRMKQDSFLITIPKHTRPFSGMYLYTARFVDVTDRIELFYLPYNMDDLNIDNDPRIELKPNGYLEYNRTDLDVPLSKDLYMIFINGKKIPPTHIQNINSSTIRMTVDPNTLKYPCISAITEDTIPQVSSYLHATDRLSKYDLLIEYIKSHATNAYEQLNDIFNVYINMTDTEEDRVWANVAKIAILNEVIRDWWVTSGYNYNAAPFIYDYEMDDLFERMPNGMISLPSMDARPEINIRKNDISFVYFYTQPNQLLFEIGSPAQSLSFFWEYSQRLNQPWKIISQTLNGVSIPVNDRSYVWNENIYKHKDFLFKANTGQNILQQKIAVDFVNGIYWGTIDEDELDDYQMLSAYQDLNYVLAVVIPEGEPMPLEAYQDIQYDTIRETNRFYEENHVITGITYIEHVTEYGFWFDEYSLYPNTFWLQPNVANIDSNQFVAVMDNNNIIRNLWAINDSGPPFPEHALNVDHEAFVAILEDGTIVPLDTIIDMTYEFNAPIEYIGDYEIFAITESGQIIHDIFIQRYEYSFDNPGLINIDDQSFIAILEDGRILRNITNYYDPSKPMNIRRYLSEKDLPDIIRNRLDKHLVREPNIRINDYIIGNNKYFLFACPKRLVYDDNNHYHAAFYFPDLNSEEMTRYFRDDKTTPVYTNGKIDPETGSFVKLDFMRMIYIGETEYTNDYGVTERYMVWRTNGFFTRLYENHGITMHFDIGPSHTVSPVVYTNKQEHITDINYINGIETPTPIPDTERTQNTMPDNTITISTSETGSTTTTNNAASIKKNAVGKTTNVEDKPTDNIQTIMYSDNDGVDPIRRAELLQQGIFLI